MKFIPYERFTIQSTVSADGIRRALRDDTLFDNSIGRKEAAKVKKFFIGQVAGTEFEILPILQKRNSFIPFIRGKISAGSAGTEVSVVMRPDGKILGLMIFYLALCAAGIVTTVIKSVQAGALQTNWGGPVLLMALGYLLMIFSFGDPADACKKRLTEIVRGAEGAAEPPKQG